MLLKTHEHIAVIVRSGDHEKKWEILPNQHRLRPHPLPPLPPSCATPRCRRRLPCDREYGCRRRGDHAYLFVRISVWDSNVLRAPRLQEIWRQDRLQVTRLNRFDQIPPTTNEAES